MCAFDSSPVYSAPVSSAEASWRSGRRVALPASAHRSTCAPQMRCIRSRYAAIASSVRTACSITSLRAWCSLPSISASEPWNICSTETGSVPPRSTRGSVANWWNASWPDTITKLKPKSRVLKIGPYFAKWSL